MASHRNIADGQLGPIFSRRISAPCFDHKLDVQVRIGRVRAQQVQVRVDDIDLGRNFQVAGGDITLAADRQVQPRRPIFVHDQAQLLHVEDEGRHVLSDMRNIGKLMVYAADAQRGYRGPGQGREQGPA